MATNDEIVEDHKEDEGDEGYRGTGKYKPDSVRFMLDEARAATAKQIFDELEKLRIDYGFDTEYLISEFEKKRIEYLNLKNKYKVD
jgi:hypothetical protein